MHGVKNNINGNSRKYRVNRKLNENNSHNQVSRYALCINGDPVRYFSSMKAAMKAASDMEESFLNEDDPILPIINIIMETMEMFEMFEEG